MGGPDAPPLNALDRPGRMPWDATTAPTPAETRDTANSSRKVVAGRVVPQNDRASLRSACLSMGAPPTLNFGNPAGVRPGLALPDRLVHYPQLLYRQRPIPHGQVLITSGHLPSPSSLLLPPFPLQPLTGVCFFALQNRPFWTTKDRSSIRQPLYHARYAGFYDTSPFLSVP